MQRSAPCTLALLAGVSFLTGAGVALGGESAAVSSGDLYVATESGRILKLSGERW
jgi:hypothetical protein